MKPYYGCWAAVVLHHLQCRQSPITERTFDCKASFRTRPNLSWSQHHCADLHRPETCGNRMRMKEIRNRTYEPPPHIPHKYEKVPSVNNAASALITAAESIGELWHVMNLLWILNRNGGSLQGAAETKDMRSNAIMQQSSFLLKAPNWLVDYAFSAPPSRWVFFNSSIMTLLYWTAKSQPIRIVIGSN